MINIAKFMLAIVVNKLIWDQNREVTPAVDGACNYNTVFKMARSSAFCICNIRSGYCVISVIFVTSRVWLPPNLYQMILDIIFNWIHVNINCMCCFIGILLPNVINTKYPIEVTQNKNSNTFLSVGGRVRHMAVGISKKEMPTLNSTSINAILKCFKMVRPFTLNTKLVLPCNTGEKTRWVQRETIRVVFLQTTTLHLHALDILSINWAAFDSSINQYSCTGKYV